MLNINCKKSSLTLVILLLAFSFSYSQSRAVLTGNVSDAYGNLPGANITIEGTTLKTTTNIDGNYTVDLEEGDYVVTVNYIMYKTQSKSVSVKVGDEVSLDFILESGQSIDEPISLGTRSEPKSLLQTTVPVDILTPEEISNSTHFELGKVLHYLVPSFHSTQQTISDGTDHIDPATLRGLGTDQVLVLINGKRRHTSSLLNVNGTVGRGSVGTDFNAIPISAIDHVEILRDGATSQYGSDAIAGVINIVLKQQTDIINIDTRLKGNTEGDGVTRFVGANLGLKIGNTGFVNITGEFRDRDAVNRAGQYTGQVYTNDVSADQILINDNNFFGQTGYDDKQVMEIGSAATRNLALMFNGEMSLFNRANLYFFGGRNSREGRSKGFYRFPKDKDRVVLDLFPNGFSPEILTDIQDNNLTIGILGQKNDWNIDFSHSMGSNSIGFTVNNSNNASLGSTSPKTFNSGGYNYQLNTTNLDLNKSFDVLEGLNFAFGGELRVECYEIIAGELASYADGDASFINDNGVTEQAIAGAQVFPGIQPQDELKRFRTNTSGYIDAELYPIKDLLFKGALRYESSNDFEDKLIWKLSGLYKVLNDKLAFRASYSTGFRAPSLHQVYFQKISTQYIDGELNVVGTFNHESSLVTDVFNVPELKPELSKHISFGATSKLSDKFNVSLDYYNIKIDDRIVLSGQFSENRFPDIANYRVTDAQFFVNAINSRTQGIDATINYKDKIGKGDFYARVSANFTETEVLHVSNLSNSRASENALFNREERARIEHAQPNFKINADTSYETNKFKFNLNGTYVGEVVYIHPDDGDIDNWQLNTFTGNVESRDQVFSPKFITDAQITYKVDDWFYATVGCNNIFNVYPDKHTHSANTSNGNFTYSRRVNQFGINGSNGFVKLLFRL